MKKCLFVLFLSTVLLNISPECPCCGTSDLAALRKEDNEVSANLRHVRDEVYKWWKYHNDLLIKKGDEDHRGMKLYIDVKKEGERRKNMSSPKK